MRAGSAGPLTPDEVGPAPVLFRSGAHFSRPLQARRWQTQAAPALLPAGMRHSGLAWGVGR